MKEIQGKSTLIRVGARFELTRVRENFNYFVIMSAVTNDVGLE